MHFAIRFITSCTHRHVHSASSEYHCSLHMYTVTLPSCNEMKMSFDASDAVMSSPVTVHGMVVGQVSPFKTSLLANLSCLSSTLSTLVTILYTTCYVLGQSLRASNVNFRVRDHRTTVKSTTNSVGLSVFDA